jgi:hypothetical protein
LGFRRLGWDVVFIDRLEPEMCLDERGRPLPPLRSRNLKYLQEVMSRFDLNGAWSLLYDGARHVFGISKPELLARMQEAAALFNIMGFLDDRELLNAITRRVFLDIDPGFPQMWHELELTDPFHTHTDFVTIAKNIGDQGCVIPTCGLKWIRTVQPIVLEHWRPMVQEHRVFTTVASWRGVNAPIDYRGGRYGLRVHEFRSFIPLPRESGNRFELALDIHPGDRRDRELLEQNGWALVDPREVAGDPWTYRRYIQSSAAEFTVAKNMYVQTQSGWFSDRSVCYLASGKPVLAQDTGLRYLEPGEGLVTFRTLEEAVAGAKEICGNYSRHARAARNLAEERFDSDRVLPELLAKVGIA